MLKTEELEHLQILLHKEPIIATWTAQDLLEHPETVRENYLRHVRSFVIIGKGVASLDSDQPTITEYEKRLIKLVKENGAAKGYITAEYGYGKTSTAAFIWHRCEQSEIVAVPPFQIQKLEHLLSATYGWVRFKLGNSAPQLLERAEQIYQTHVKRGIELETEDEDQRALLKRLQQEGRYSPELQALDYLYFFEEMTALVREAGYSGLVVIADEVQQYIDPDIKAGVRDPLTELFNLIQALLTRKGHLPFALLFSIPEKELGLMNDQRSDLVQRLKSDGLALDLGTIYNQTFAHALWDQLAHDLQFESLKDQITLPETLEALGQISARPDLASGPRTVVDVFRFMAQRYQQQDDQIEPFSPLDLVNAFLQNTIHYDNIAKLQRVTLGHLNHQFVKDQPTYQNAIKLMAAFPIDGLPERYFDRYQVRDALDKLLKEAQGDIVTLLGGGFNEIGQRSETRAFLCGLEAQQTNTNWLDGTIREFMRNYQEAGRRYQVLALQGFQNLLKEHIFKGDNWKFTRSLDPTFTQNRTLFYEGAFPNATKKRYPARSLQIQMLSDKDELRTFEIDGDLVLTFRLELNYDQPTKKRRTLPGQISSQEKVTTFLLNISYISDQENYGDLQATLGPIVSPWEMTPILLLSLYAYLVEKQEANVIPKADDELIRANFQPVLLEHAFNQLFNNDLGAEMGGVGGIRIVEILVKRELEKHYANYQTLITNMQWKQSLKRYRLALEHLRTPYERQGRELFESTKKSLAEQTFMVSVPALETFINTSPLFLKQEVLDKWRFTLHPLEEQIMRQIKASHHTEPPRSGGKVRHKLQQYAIYKIAKEQGYRNEEIEETLTLLLKREMVSFNPNRSWIIAEEIHVPQLSELRNTFAYYQARLKTVHEALKDDPEVDKLVQEETKYAQVLENLGKKSDEQTQTGLESHLRRLQGNLDTIVQRGKQYIFERAKQRSQQGVGNQLSSRVLEQTLPEGAFQAQLQTQKISLLKTYGELVEKRDRLKGQLDALYKSAVSEEAFSETDLLRAGQEEQRVFADINQMEKQILPFQQTLEAYEKARQLLRQANDLQQRLKQVASESMSINQKELDNWSLHITGELSSQKLQALKHYAAWQDQFDNLKRTVDTQLQAERERFQRVQQEYRTCLSQNSGGHWFDVVFNPSEPRDSYKQLWEQVYELLRTSVNRVQDDLRSAYERTARLRGSALEDLSATERVALQHNISEIQLHLNATIGKTAGWAAAVSKERLFEKIGVDGELKPAEMVLGPVLKQVQEVDEWLANIEETLYSYEQRVTSAHLTSQEETILATLKKLQQSVGMLAEVELGVLLQHPDMQDVSWQHLLSLYSKRRLSIKIAPVTFR